MSEDQQNWRDLEAIYGNDGAKNELARRLREFADTIESDGYPDVFGYAIHDNGTMRQISVTLSFPWGG